MLRKIISMDHSRILGPDPDPFLVWVRETEMVDYPEFAADNQYLPEGPGSGKYILFAPSWHFLYELITQAMVEDLRAHPEKRLLSMGAGPAYLERFLVKHLGIRCEQIILADEDPVHPAHGSGFYRFDYSQPWPQLRERFDYIIFPESFFTSEGRPDGSAGFLEDSEQLSRVVAEAQMYLKLGGEIRISPSLRPQEIIDRAAQILADQGKPVSITYVRGAMIVRRQTP